MSALNKFIAARKIHAFRVSIKQITINLLDVLSIAFNCHTEKCIDLSNHSIGEFYLQCGQTHTHIFLAHFRNFNKLTSCRLKLKCDIFQMERLSQSAKWVGGG